MKDSSISLGATKWQTVKHVTLKRSSTGLLSAVLLGFSRAFGETMAVLMVTGNGVATPKGVFDAGQPLPALIANQYGEIMTLELGESAMMFAALLLMTVVVIFNLIARLALRRMGERRGGVI